MGGKGSGGRRVGAGRKPKDAQLRAIQGGRDRRPGALTSTAGAVPPAAPPVDAVPPPADLTPDELKVWEREAPLAITERTLTSATVGAFREFCELAAFTGRMLAQIRTEPLTVETATGVKANPIIAQYRGAVQRVAAWRKDFKLAPFGKELAPPLEQPAANPLDRFRLRRPS